MFHFNISSKEVSHSEIAEWFAARDAAFTYTSTYVKDWIGKHHYQILEIGIKDENLAIEFRLTFSPKLGESSESKQIKLEEELMAVLTADIAKEIDEAILNDLRNL
jgi:hypothetical protein